MEFHTMGFNPYFHDADLVQSKMTESSEAMGIASDVDRVYFYGAGSSTQTMCEIIERGLRAVFPTAEAPACYQAMINAKHFGKLVVAD